MSIALAFDTHEFIKTLESAGMPLPQAEAISRAVSNVQAASDVATKADLEALRSDVATKSDLEALRKDTEALDTKIVLLRKDMDAGFSRVDARFESMETKFKLQMDALQNKLVIKLSLVMVGLVGLMVTAQRFFL